jgi:cell division topological specificity factor
MGMFDFLKVKKNTASIAKDRLRIIIAQERTNRSGPDYLPLLRNELLEVIRKYVSVEPDAVQVNLERGNEGEVLELSVTLPEARPATGTVG